MVRAYLLSKAQIIRNFCCDSYVGLVNNCCFFTHVYHKCPPGGIPGHSEGTVGRGGGGVG